MKLGIMQPYFFPYIGYFQLINATDVFVVYDNIQFTKKGWINRNRILVNGKDEYISLPLKKDSDYLNVCERRLADSWEADKVKLLRKLTAAYQKAPEYKNVFPLIESVINYSGVNVFDFIFNSLTAVCGYLDISTRLVISSSVPIDHTLKSQEKVLEICKALQADEYINPIGGTELYSKQVFENENIKLSFLKATEVNYTQYGGEFIPWLSVIDVLMFNTKDQVKQYLNYNYTIQ